MANPTYSTDQILDPTEHKQTHDDIASGANDTANNKMETFRSEAIADFVASGGVITQDSGLNGSMTAAVVYISGKRVTASSVSGHAYTASKDTYVDIDNTGAVSYSEVANGAASPSLASNKIRIAKVVTSGAAITSIVQYGSDSLTNPIYNNSPAKNLSWKSWTPTFNNFTLGNGSVTAYYIRIGKLVAFRIIITLGSTSSVSAAPKFSLPVTPNSNTADPGTIVKMIDSSASTAYMGHLFISSGNAEWVVLNASTTYLQESQVNSTVPFTWATSDSIEANGFYEAS